MSKAFAEKILDTIWAKANGETCGISHRQYEIVTEYLEHNRYSDSYGYFQGYQGNLGKYKVEISVYSARGAICKLSLRDETEVKEERKAEEAAEAKRKALLDFSNSGWVAEPRKRLDLTLTLANVWCGEYMFIYTFRDQDGNCLVWKTQKTIDVYDPETDTWGYAKTGDTIEMRATVKEHGEYRGTKQTVITRPQLKGIS